ncbi:NmrA-like family protein [Microdochium trichocladiopsis]|uniref:NmrA-like family protein n=1 Tax=Microdochium trichocladiopsis TaxID=1682393 RepID=A0A9P8Y236_9PEZI|nr:NmrA-like family protein [Microdochium trichocladiopsis]KAH7027706.1 NmrA-like family protein [Microdochium trichocladiopsis]
MASKKILTIFGATGAQGGGIISTFLHDAKLKNEWALRGVTRDVSKDSAKKLASQGVEVVAADLNDKASLVKAMKDSYAVFAVTNYWEKADADLEIKQGKDLADAAKETGVQHYIWSTLYNVSERSNGKLPHVYHFDTKAKVADYVRQLGIPATFFMPGFYVSNIPGGMFRQAPPDNNWRFALPVKGDSQIPYYAPKEDTGKYIKAIVNNRDKLLGKNFLAATAYTTPFEMVETFKKLFPEAGATAQYVELPGDVYKGLIKQNMSAPDFIAEELYENMRLLEEFGYYFGEDLKPSLDLVDEPLTTWEEYAKKAPAFKDLK